MIRIVYTPIGVVIGEKTNAELGLMALKDPRLITVDKNENGRIKFNVGPLLGNPKGFEIERGTSNHDCNDENILNAYKESVTGIELVKHPPLVDSAGKVMQ
jgi:hypothetical protein